MIVNPRKISRGKDILHRIKALETEIDGIQEHFNNLTKGLDAILGNRDQVFSKMDEVVRALVAVVGEDKVVGQLNTWRDERTSKAAQSAFDALEATKASGVAVVSDIVTDKSLLVVEQYKADGTPDSPAKVPVSVLSIEPELLSQALGKGVGARIDGKDGSYLVVVEIYAIDEARATQVEAEALEKAAQETAEITGADAQ